MAATIVAYFRKPLRMMPCSSRVEKNLHASNKLKHGSWALQLNAQPAAVKNLRPAIPAQNPNQPRFWLAEHCQRWSRKPNNRRAAPDTYYRTTLTGAGELYNERGERAGILPCGCKIHHALSKIPRLFQNGNQRNLLVLAKNQNDQKAYLTKIILRSFGCCPQRNLGISSRRQRLKRAPTGAR
jgi:hypothetical protein